MWKQDGPDMLYCDGRMIWRIKPLNLDKFGYAIIPLEISPERFLSPGEEGIPIKWPTKYE
jgi:hypothetical protein